MDNMNRFDDIEHMPLRVYNRVVMSHNIAADAGEEAAREYVAQFNENERKQMFFVNTYLAQKGQKATYEFVTKGLEIQYNVGEEEENVTVH